MNEKYLKPYNPKEAEENIYKEWNESGYFNPDNLPNERKETFSMVLPPPNVTGKLHLGHADMLAIQDTVVRFQRMLGKKLFGSPEPTTLLSPLKLKWRSFSQKRKSESTISEERNF